MHALSTPSILTTSSRDACPLHICDICDSWTAPGAVHLSIGRLHQHCKLKHAPPTRNKRTSELLYNAFASPNSTNNNWTDTLAWLDTIELRPPPFRFNLWHNLHNTDKDIIFECFHTLLQVLLKANVTPDSDESAPWPAFEKHADPLWHLTFMFQFIILCPHREHSTATLRQIIKTRICLFRQGRIQQLFDHAMASTRAITPLTSLRTSTLDIDDILAADDPHDLDNNPIAFDARTTASAQRAADCDNYATATNRLKREMPVATLDPATVQHIVHTLYPEKLPPHEPTVTPQRTTRSSSARTKQPFQLDPKIVRRAMHKIRKGTAAGPFADYTDFLRAFAMHAASNPNDDPDDTTTANMDTFIATSQLIIDGHLSESVAKHFRSAYFLALHKDTLDPLKLRPIGIGTAFRRIIGSIIMAHHNESFAAHLLPAGQLGVGISGGINVIAHLTQLLVSRHVADPSRCTRVLIALDIVNMFNACSRETCRSSILKHFPRLIPFFDLLYSEDNMCWYLDHQGCWNAFLQTEGFAQGCPLSPLFASLVLDEVLRPLQDELAQRARSRKRSGLFGDDDYGSLSATLAYFDDSSAVVPYDDTFFYLQRFATLGAPHGIIISTSKTKILTTTSGASPIPLLPPQLSAPITQALALLDDGAECTLGLTLVGQPIGGLAYSTQFLHTKCLAFKRLTKQILFGIHDPQTQATLFRHCVQSTTDHLLSSDVLLNYQDDTPPAFMDWHSSFTNQIDNTLALFLQRLAMQSDPLPAYAQDLATLPAQLGGLGFRSASTAAIPAFVIPIARSIRLAIHGLTAPQIGPHPVTSHLPPPFRRALLSWEQAPDRLFHLFRTLAPALLEFHLPPDTDRNVTVMFTSLELSGLQRDLCRKKQRQTIPNLAQSAPAHVVSNLVSLTSPHTSMAMHGMSRQEIALRLRPQLYTLALQRKLRLPCIPPDLIDKHCICGSTLDSFGDHLTQCQHFGKRKAHQHDHLRDCVYTICRRLAPLAGFAPATSAIALEPKHLIPNSNARPADVYISLSPTYLRTPATNPSKALAIDVVVTPPPPSLPSSVPLNAVPATYWHNEKAKNKFRGNHTDYTSPDTIAHLTAARTQLLPFTVDPLGGLGYFAHRFLFGTTGSKPCPPAPSWSPNDLPPAAFASYQYTTGPLAITGLLPAADASWRSSFHSTSFGSSYQAHLPSQWALQTLGCNMIRALNGHLLRAFTDIRAHHVPTLPLRHTACVTPRFPARPFSAPFHARQLPSGYGL